MRVRYTDFVDVDIDANVQFQEFEYLTDQTIPDEWFSYAWNVFKDGVDWSRSGCDFNKDDDADKWRKNYSDYINNFPKTRTIPKRFFKHFGPVISNLQLGRRYKRSIICKRTYTRIIQKDRRQENNQETISQKVILKSWHLCTFMILNQQLI